ncbi:MAG TPA: HAD family hydrolase [Syntrophomonadaceae bacterium]|nr:HAD family hydrolase [Syntrophomonadaceae bacterium]
MFEAILFDLDGTLLDIDMNYFIPKYFEKMMVMAQDFGIDQVKKMAEQIYKSTDVMISNVNSELTNEEVFMQDFLYKFNHLTKDEAMDFFDHFYAHGFPKLSHHSKPFMGVPEMMAKIFARDVKVVIATNSVFPRPAIVERMNWAGVDNFDYQLITSYEVMHFCKPWPEYYEEIAQIIGVQPKNCLMVGNDIGEDLAAGKVGMKTYLVKDRLIDKGIDLKPDYSGNLVDLFEFMDRI